MARFLLAMWFDLQLGFTKHDLECLLAAQFVHLAQLCPQGTYGRQELAQPPQCSL